MRICHEQLDIAVVPVLIRLTWH